MFNNVVNAWWPLLFYSAADAPKFKKGMICMICVAVATLLITAVVRVLERRDERRSERRDDSSVSGSVAADKNDVKGYSDGNQLEPSAVE